MVQQTLIADFKQFPARSLLVLATEVNELILHEACRYEALGYLLETAPGECFRMSLHQKPGQFLLDPTLTSMGLKAYFEKHEDALLEELTAREREVLLLMREGCSNREIALQLQICEDTVKKHVAHIYKN